LTLARDGFAVALTATREQNLAGIVGELHALGVAALPLALDLREQASIETAVAKIVGHFGQIDVLVNNAGANLLGKAVDITRAEWDSLFATNVTGTFFLTQQVGRHLIARGAHGRIITIASVQAFIGAAGRSVYGIGKAALVQMTRMLAIEWAEHDITVNAVAPGRLDTQSPSRASTGADPAYMEAMLKRIPLHRLTTAEEVAGAVAFLAGPAAGTITGQTIVIDGGLSTA
jgi:NAD(P)-dependent dehydrogenase (short-subunit alcohol dehydrogenase family)